MSSTDDNPLADAVIEADHSPLARLETSRAILRAKLLDGQQPYDPSKARDDSDPHGSEPSWLTALAESLSNVPAATVAARWLRRWWASHPWRATADVAIAVATELAVPVAKRHPWLLVGGAMVGGALLSKARPWRWVSGGALLASFMPRIQLSTLLHWITETLTTMQPMAPQQQQQQQQHQQQGTAGEPPSSYSAASSSAAPSASVQRSEAAQPH